MNDESESILKDISTYLQVEHLMYILKQAQEKNGLTNDDVFNLPIAIKARGETAVLLISIQEILTGSICGKPCLFLDIGSLEQLREKLAQRMDN